MKFSSIITNVVAIAFFICAMSTTTTKAQTVMATNVSSSSIQSSSAIITWLVPDDLSSATSYLLSIVNEAEAVVANVTITDVTLTSYEVTGLSYSTWHNATLDTLDSSGTRIGGGSSHMFITAYDPVNVRALGAIGVVAFLIIVLVIVKAAAIVCNPDKANEKWKQEILVTKQREREERKKRLSSAPAMESKEESGLDLV